MSALQVADVRLYTYELPLVRPLSLAGVEYLARKGLLIEVAAEDGRTSWGDAAPLPGFSRETLEEVVDQARSLRGQMLGLLQQERQVSTSLVPLASCDGGLLPSLAFALEAARDDLSGAQHTFTEPVSVNGLLTGTDEEIRHRAGSLAQEGYRTLKVKVGRHSPEQALWLLNSLCRIASPQVQFRIDANRAWTFDEAVHFAEGLSGLPYEYVEEPLREPARLSELAERTGLRIALDETLSDLEQDHMEHHTYASAIVLKPTILGAGRLAGLVRAAKGLGFTVTLSAAFESGVGVKAVAALAGRMGLAGTAHGLDTYSWLAEDLLEPRLRMEGGRMDLGALAGSPPQLRRDLLAEVR